MKIQVLSVNVNHIPNAKGGYDVAEVAYKDIAKNTVAGKKIMSFTDKDLFKAVKDLTPNRFYEVTVAKEPNKDGKEYWNWKSIVETDAETPAAKPGTTTVRGNYETPEERATRQSHIVKQSSIANAIATLKTEKASVSPDDVLSIAERYYNWVYSPLNGTTVEELPQDIPA